MSQYKLTYYHLRGRGELVRFIFAQADVKYEDNRLSIEQWAQLKASSPFGTIPYLEYDGKVLSSSMAISRMLAEQYGLAATNDTDNAELFSIVDATADAWFQIYAAVFHEKDEKRKAVMVKKLHEEYLPDMINRFEQRAAANNAPEGWIWGEKLTYADFAMYLLFEYAVANLPGSIEDHPTLTKLKASVEKLPNIARWLRERPATVVDL